MTNMSTIFRTFLNLILKQPPLTPRIEQKNFLKAHSRTGSPLVRPQSARQAPSESSTKAPVEKKFASKDDIDFIKRNQKLAKEVQIKRAPSMENLRSVQEKLNNDLKVYQEKIKGKIPD